jgi:acetolactate synthase-1/2/3 large subunit
MTRFSGTGGKIIVEMLARQGVRRVSCVAGESYLAVLDALLDHPEIEVVTCRQEGGAAFIAESWGKLDATVPGVCLVTRGPGVCNAAIGVHTAMQDSTPLIVLMGQVGRGDMGREAFQEIDVKQVFGGLAKWAVEIDDPARAPEIMRRAFKVALSGRPGPVVIGLPEDMLTEEAEVPLPPPAAPITPGIKGGEFAQLKEMLKQAARPVVIAGGTGWSDADCHNLMKFARSSNLPVAASFRRQDLFDHNNSCYVGELGTGPNPALVAAIRDDADLVIFLGGRLNEITTQTYTLLDAPLPRQTLVHINASEEELGKVYAPALAIHAGISEALAQLAGEFSIDGRKWNDWMSGLRALYTDWTALPKEPNPGWRGADMHAIFSFLRETLPADAIVTTDAGNFSGWAQRYLRYGRPGRLLAPTSGAMGYGVPAAVGAALMARERLVLGLCGDGGFMMTGQEIATALHHGAKPVILVCNNGMYGTIRMHQEKHYPGRVSGTKLTNPDFAALAQSYGAFGAAVADANDLPAAWHDALQADRLALIEIRMDPAQLTTNAKPG